MRNRNKGLKINRRKMESNIKENRKGRRESNYIGHIMKGKGRRI